MANYFLDDLAFLPSDAATANFLWEEGTPLFDEFRKIAEHIATRSEGFSPRSMTFAIYGKWGTGKSSAVNITLEMCQQHARSWDGELVICNFVASRFQHEFRDNKVPLRQTLARELLISIFDHLHKGDDPALSLVFMRQFPAAYAEVLDEIEATGDDNKQRVRLVAERFTTLAVQSSAFDASLNEFMRERPNLRKVVIIDDLDRCDPEYIYQMLTQTQQWSGSIHNMYFLIAVDRDNLRRAVKREDVQTVAQQDYALEKYVQHFVLLPTLELDLAQRFLERLLPSDSALDRFIRANADLIYHGIKRKTPRSLKRSINVLALPLGKYLFSNSDRSSSRRWMWERMLEYTWGRFYSEFYVREIDAKGLASADLNGLFTICQRYVMTGSDREVFNFDLQRLQRKAPNQDWAGIQEADQIDYDLVYYLGHDALNPHLAKSEQIEKPSVDESNPLRRSLEMPSTMSNLEVITKLRELTTEAQLARTLQDKDKTYYYATEAYNLVQNNRAALTGLGDEYQVTSYLGDVAGYLSQLDLDKESCVLFEYTFTFHAEPRVYVNNVTRYITAVLALEDLSRLESATRYLDELKGPNFSGVADAGRLALLEARMSMLQAKVSGPMPDADDLQRMRLLLSQRPDERMIYSAAAAQAQAFKDYLALREFTKVHIPTIGRDNQDGIYTTLRILADGLAGSDKPEDEFEAMEIYRLFFRLEMCNPAPEQWRDLKRDLADIYFNYGMLLYKHDYDDVAGYFWFEAYRLAPTDGATKRAYARYLGRAGDVELARRVTESLPLDRVVLYPSQKTMPPSFMAEDAEKWWLESIDSDYNCTTAEYPVPNMPPGGTIITATPSSRN